MMDQAQLEIALSDLPLGGIRYFKRVSSTNDEAAQWAAEGAADFSLVIAADQTSGRGRVGRTWYTVPGASLAMSIILYPPENLLSILPRMTALGALAVRDALMKKYHLPAQVKWPNDVLLHHRKVSGVLAEAYWNGNELAALILGIGVNIAASSISSINPDDENAFPATFLEAELKQSIKPLPLLHAILVELKEWRRCIAAPEFMQAWENSLAYRGEWVQVSSDHYDCQDRLVNYTEGRMIGLSPDGSLKLHTQTGEIVFVHVGDVRLRPGKSTAILLSI